MLEEKRKDTWIYEDKKMQRTSKIALKQWIYTCRSLWIAGRRDSTLFGVVDDTTTTKFTGRACAVHCNSLPVVVDKVVVVVLKFPNVRKSSAILATQPPITREISSSREVSDPGKPKAERVKTRMPINGVETPQYFIEAAASGIC